MKANSFIDQLENYESVEKFLLLKNQIMSVLYQIDPIGTGCVENEDYTEYGHEAVEIAKMIKCGFHLEFAVRMVFDTMFWDDCLSEESLNTICSHTPNSSNL